MKNILILASGSIAKHFIEWVGNNRVAQNQYYVMHYKDNTIPEKIGQNIKLIDADPTSFLQLNRALQSVKFLNIFIIIEDFEDTKYVLKNIEIIHSKARTILVNQWNDNSIGKDNENIAVLYSHELISGHIYDLLPNVPLVAQNVGLGRGEIMEVHVPFGSSYAYRHIGSIQQRKWKISALYRNEKQILPTNATMVRPNDTLLIVGKPIVLNGVYRAINKITGLFPEPFGNNIYLVLDFRLDKKNIIRYIKESIYLVDKLEGKELFIRVLNPNDFELLDKIKKFEAKNITISVCYDMKDIKSLIEYDIHEQNIGLVMNSIPTFESGNLKNVLYQLKKLVFLFGDTTMCDIDKSIVLMCEDEKMESISSSSFDISETLGLDFILGDFNPEGDFEHKKMIIEHYETLSNIFNIDMKLEQKTVNPIRELLNMDNILQIAPFEKELNSHSYMKYLSSKVQDFLLTTQRHPKLLIPFAISEV